MLLNIKCVLVFSTAFHILRRNERDTIKNMFIGLHVSTPYSRRILMKIILSGHILEK